MQDGKLTYKKPLPTIINPEGKLPRGVSNFPKLAEGDYTFIDKSLFIKDVLDNGDDIMLITRPRRFGKTLNMSMLHEFLTKAPTEKDPFEGLAIQNADASYQLERGKRPVLFLSFKDIKEDNWIDAFKDIRSLLSQTIDQLHFSDIHLQQLSSSQLLTLNAVRDQKADERQLTDSLTILTQLLTIQHGEKPWVLIDEYDTPMQTAYQYGFYDEMRKSMRSLLSKCLKDNFNKQTGESYLHKAVLTGILRIAKEDIFSGLNNLGAYGVLDEKFSTHFGFTPEETTALLNQKGLSTYQETVREWYNGYSFGKNTIYNPWSIISFVASQEHAPKLFWVNTSNNHLVHELLAKAEVQVKQGLKELIENPVGHTTQQSIYEYIPLSEVEDDSKSIWGILLAAGYVTANGCERIEESSECIVQLQIPNKEVRCVYGDLIHKWMGKRGGVSGEGLIDYLLSGDLDIFSVDFPTFFRESASYFDANKNEPEKFYHGFMLGMLQYLRHDYVVLSQREAGGGRYDLSLEPRNKSDAGFIFEFKRAFDLKPEVTDLQQKLEHSAQEALQQIVSKAYTTQLFAAGVKTVHALGLAFSGKEVKVAWETFTKTQ